MTTFEQATETVETAEAEGGYRAPELQAAGAATSLVQGWAFSGWDCGYATFYNAGYC